MRIFLKLCLLASVMGPLVRPASAVDVVATPPPQTIIDDQLTIGSRTLRLPGGNWSFVAQHKGVVINTANNREVGTTYKVYAVDVKNGSFHNGVELRLPISSFYTRSWRPEPCKVDGFLFKDDFNSGFTTPECLTVYKKSSHLIRPSGDFYPQAGQWLSNQDVKQPGAVYEITYTKYATNDFGQIRLWVPVKNVAGDDAIIAWAQGLPDQLRAFFENRDSDAALSPIPSKY